MNAQEMRRAAASALVAVQRLFLQRGWAQTQPIDIFSLIVEDGITLYFKPFKRLAGAYIPAAEGDSPLITVNENHPLALQRYTAGHEYGHHIAHSDSICDTDVDVLARGATPRNYAEAFAESFAAWLLMPRQLVVSKGRDLQLPDVLGPDHVYRLSLELGTSYDATLTQLLVLHRLSQARYTALRKVPPKATKEHIAGGPRVNSRADVWTLTDLTADQLVRAKVDDEVIIDLVERPGTSYMWQMVDWDPQCVRDVRSIFIAAREEVPTYDPAGHRRVRFTVARPGRWRLPVVLRSPFAMEPARQHAVTLEVAVPHHGPYEELDELATLSST